MRNTLAGGVRRLLLVLAAVGVALWPASPALAHNQLVSAKPAKNAVLPQAPATVDLAFLQRLDPEHTTITVSDAGRQPVPVSAPAIKAATAKVTFDQPLGNGKYTVAYRVVSVDGHPVQGSYTFTVDDPSASAAASAPVVAAPSAEIAPSAGASAPGVLVAAPADSGGGSAGVLIGAGGLGVLLAAVAAYLFVSRRRRSAAARP